MSQLIKATLLASLTCLPLMSEAQGNGGRNNPLGCPPGLAKKDPACVPPGLARQGVTTLEYLGIADDEWEEIVAENPELAEDDADTDVAEDDTTTGPLTDDEVVEVFDVAPPQDGQTYGVVDGQVVALDPEEALIFEQVKLLSSPVPSNSGIEVVPDVALSQDQLIAIYDLPEPAPGTSYAVIDGEIYAVPDETYGLLQVIRITTAL